VFILQVALRVHAIQLDQLHYHSDDIALLEVESGIFYPVGDESVDDAPEARDEDSDSSPSTETQPPVDNEAAALGV
jgi:hypothetical protein